MDSQVFGPWVQNSGFTFSLCPNVCTPKMAKDGLSAYSASSCGCLPVPCNKFLFSAFHHVSLFGTQKPRSLGLVLKLHLQEGMG
jgi:hypothetical protein